MNDKNAVIACWPSEQASDKSCKAYNKKNSICLLITCRTYNHKMQ